MKRREFIGSSASSLLVPGLFSSRKNQSLRIAHVTDMHIIENTPAESAIEKLFKKIQNEHKPDLIFNGGDVIMDALDQDKDSVKKQWQLRRRLFDQVDGIPQVHCLGNHDIYGWYRKNLSGKDDGYGRQWACEELGLAQPYFTFQKGGWQFIILDTVQKDEYHGYTGHVDDLQFEWLEQELESSGRQQIPVLIMTHIPIFSAAYRLFSPSKQGDAPSLWAHHCLMHTDVWRLKQLFAKYQHIKVCISGHLHLQEEINYLGIKFLCNGAVSGNWWKGNFQEFAPSYTIMELMPDGNFKYQWQLY